VKLRLKALWRYLRSGDRPMVIAVITAGFIVLFIVALIIAHGGPGVSSPTQYSSPGGSPFGTQVKTLATSRHVTGLPYPKQCTLGSAGGHALPDKACTPGAADAEVMVPTVGNPGNLQGTICTSGWTQEASALDQELVPVKAAADAAYNIRGQSVLVWLVPISLGGSNDVSNLYVMPVNSSNDSGAKANVDATVNKAVCAGTIGVGRGPDRGGIKLDYRAEPAWPWRLTCVRVRSGFGLF
jgi:hypothetical protein